MAYSDKVLDHYENPRNVGSFGKDDDTVGTGLVVGDDGLADRGRWPGQPGPGLAHRFFVGDTDGRRGQRAGSQDPADGGG